MEERLLGRSGIRVSRLCFGTLTFRQLDVGPKQGSEAILRAADSGVNFVDTAEGYSTYEHVRLALIQRPDLVISTKSRAVTYEDMNESVNKALSGLGRDYVDIFLMHGCGGPDDGIEQRGGALECLLDAKTAGKVRAVGLSSHYVEGMRQAAGSEEIDVGHPLVNMLGKGLPDGMALNMENACDEAHKTGKGLFGMKSLAGGLLIPRRKEAFQYVLTRPWLDSVAVGMTTKAEVDCNVRMFEGTDPDVDEPGSLKPAGLRLHILERSCVGCGDCVKACPSGAMSVDEGKAKVDKDLCIA